MDCSLWEIRDLARSTDLDDSNGAVDLIDLLRPGDVKSPGDNELTTCEDFLSEVRCFLWLFSLTLLAGDGMWSLSSLW